MSALLILSALAILFGLALGYAAIRFKVEGNPLVDQIDALLPQTQCGQCQHPGCRPYAEAIAAGEDDINKCPPGGQETADALAELMDMEKKPVAAGDNNYGSVSAVEKVAVIIEKDCIGCTLCIKACPVDAIVGATKFMHTVIESECTGCELCLPPCPVDCIEMIDIPPNLTTWVKPEPVTEVVK